MYDASYSLHIYTWYFRKLIIQTSVLMEIISRGSCVWGIYRLHFLTLFTCNKILYSRVLKLIFITGHISIMLFYRGPPYLVHMNMNTTWTQTTIEWEKILFVFLTNTSTVLMCLFPFPHHYNFVLSIVKHDAAHSWVICCACRAGGIALCRHNYFYIFNKKHFPQCWNYFQERYLSIYFFF